MSSAQVKMAPVPKSEAFVEQQLARARRRIRLLDAAATILGIVSLTFAYVLVFVLCDRWLMLSSLARQVAFGGYLGVVAGVLGVALIRPLIWRINPYYAARQVEQTLPNAKNSVVNWLDLRDEPLPPAIRGAVTNRAARDLAGADFDSAISARRTQWLGAIAAGLFLALFVMFVFGGNEFLSRLFRVFAPFTDTTPRTRTELKMVQPAEGNVTIPLGKAVPFVVEVRGQVPNPRKADAVRLLYRYHQTDPYEEQKLEREGQGTFNWVTQVPAFQVHNGFWYKIAGGDAETDEYRVWVRSTPLLSDVDVTYRYRPYLARPDAKSVEPNLEAMRGTEVMLIARANRNVREGTLEFMDAAQPVPAGKGLKPMAGGIAGGLLQADLVPGEPQAMKFQFILDRDGRYRIWFVSEDDERNTEPLVYTIKVLRDTAPTVELKKPGQNITLPVNSVLPLEGLAHDDLGVTGMTLKMQLHDKEVLLSKPYRAGKKELFRLADGSYLQNLDYKDFAELGKLKLSTGEALKPGQVLHCWLEAADDCDYPPPGPNVGKSEVFTVTLTDAQDQKQSDQQKKDAEKKQKKHEQEQDQKKKDEEKKKEESAKSPEEKKNDDINKKVQDELKKQENQGKDKPDPRDTAKGESKDEGKKQDAADKNDKGEKGDKNEKGEGKPEPKNDEGKKEAAQGKDEGKQSAEQKKNEGGDKGPGQQQQAKSDGNKQEQNKGECKECKGGQKGGAGQSKDEGKKSADQQKNEGGAKNGGKENAANSPQESKGEGKRQPQGEQAAGKPKGAGDKPGEKGGAGQGQEVGQAKPDQPPQPKGEGKNGGGKGGLTNSKGECKECKGGQSGGNGQGQAKSTKDKGGPNNESVQGSAKGEGEAQPAGANEADTKQTVEEQKEKIDNAQRQREEAKDKLNQLKREGTARARKEAAEALEKEKGGASTAADDPDKKPTDPQVRELADQMNDAKKLRDEAIEKLKELKRQTDSKDVRDAIDQAIKDAKEDGKEPREASGKPDEQPGQDPAANKTKPPDRGDKGGDPKNADPKNDGGSGKGNKGDGKPGDPKEKDPREGDPGQAKAPGKGANSGQPGDGSNRNRTNNDPANGNPDAGDGQGSDADPSFRKKAGELQLEELKKKITPEVLKKLNISEEDWNRYLKGREDALKRQREAARTPEKLDTPKGTGDLRSQGPRQMKGNATSSTPVQGGPAQPPLPLREGIKKFTEKLPTIEEK